MTPASNTTRAEPQRIICRIRHFYLKEITPFSRAQARHNLLAQEFLSHKALVSSRTPPSPLPPAPVPTILSFVPSPVYTTGRRELDTLSAEQIALLKEPFQSKKKRWFASPEVKQYAEVVQTQRGGQITFHGPGQLVLYPVLDLSAKYTLWPKGLTVRCYVNLLEQATINTLARWDIKGVRTENPGVWEEGGQRKIAALGVHLRRGIASYGVGLNVSTDLEWFDRITACGLEGKGTVSMKQILAERRYAERLRLLEQQQTTEKIQVVGDEEDMSVAPESPGEDGSEETGSLRDTLERRSLIGLRALQVAEIWGLEFASLLVGGSKRSQYFHPVGNVPQFEIGPSFTAQLTQAEEKFSALHTSGAPSTDQSAKPILSSLYQERAMLQKLMKLYPKQSSMDEAMKTEQHRIHRQLRNVRKLISLTQEQEKQPSNPHESNIEPCNTSRVRRVHVPDRTEATRREMIMDKHREQRAGLPTSQQPKSTTPSITKYPAIDDVIRSVKVAAAAAPTTTTTKETRFHYWPESIATFARAHSRHTEDAGPETSHGSSTREGALGMPLPPRPKGGVKGW